MKRFSFKKTALVTFLILVIAFFIWRFVRTVHIFTIDEKFERPLSVTVPEGLDSVSAKECKTCHEEIYKEWTKSMHAQAWTDEYYQVDWKFDGSQQICLNCHTPLENQQENLVLGFRDREKFDPILKPNPDFDPDLQNEGVTCAVCHIKNGKIVGPFETDNAPHPITVDKEMSFGIKACEMCHVVGGDRWDTFYRFPPCGTVDESKETGQEANCVGCHMPEVKRPAADGIEPRLVKRHLFRGGHTQETVKDAVKVTYEKSAHSKGITYDFTITNIGAAHYLPTGTPDRHLTLELRLKNKNEHVIKEKIFFMKRYIIWRPFIIDWKDTRLPYGTPKQFRFSIKDSEIDSQSVLDVTVRYHLLEDRQRKKIGYKNTKPISYAIYQRSIKVHTNQ